MNISVQISTLLAQGRPEINFIFSRLMLSLRPHTKESDEEGNQNTTAAYSLSPLVAEGICRVLQHRSLRIGQTA